jgi:hypothetical protein
VLEIEEYDGQIGFMQNVLLDDSKEGLCVSVKKNKYSILLHKNEQYLIQKHNN